MESGNVLQNYKTQQFIKIISDAKMMKEFDIDLYFMIVEKMIALDGKKINITLGLEIECEIN